MSPLPILLVSAIDEVVREVASMSLAVDLPEAIEVRHDLFDGHRLVCTLSDRTGIVRRFEDQLDHGCLSCAVREGLVPALRWVLDEGRWSQAVVALPVTAAPDAVAWAVDEAISSGTLPGARLAQVVTVVDQASIGRDLLGDDLVGERGIALSEADVRAVGEALALQLEYADAVVTLDDPDAPTDALLDHVLPPDVARITGLAQVDVPGLLVRDHDPHRAHRRLAPEARSRREVADRDGVWTVELVSDKAFHPTRLVEQIELIGSGSLRARGCFWLPSRPSVMCVWDGAGGQLSIGEAGLWQGRQRRTRLLVTGTDPFERERVRRAFDDILLTDHEAATAVARWAGRPDGLEEWLGDERWTDVG